MSRFAPPLCLLMALALLVAGFGTLAVEAPSDGVQLHRARAAGDEAYREALEAQLARQIWSRRVLLTGLFAGSGLMTVLAFMSMQESRD